MRMRQKLSLKRSLLSCAIALAAGGPAQGVLASTVSNSGTITATVEPGSGNAAYGIDVGDMVGMLVNTGRIEVMGLASSIAYAGGIRGSSMNDAAAIVNSGTISATGSSDSYSAYAYGIGIGAINTGSTVTNSGHITAAASASRSAYAYGIRATSMSAASAITNSGTITATASSNRSSASAHGIDIGAISTGSTVTNAGRITAIAESYDSSAYAWGIEAGSLQDGTAILNSGTIAAAASGRYSASAHGIDIGTLNGSASVGNSGVIVAAAAGSSSVAAYGMAVDSLNGTSAVANSGQITAAAVAFWSTASANAYGIHAGVLGSGTSLSNSGSIDVEASAESGNAYGLYIAGSVAAGATIANSGTITVSNGATLSNFDYLHSLPHGGEAFGIKVVAANATGVTVDNSGMVDGGVSLNGGMITTMSCMPMISTGTCIPMMLPGGPGTVSLTNAGVIATGALTQSRVDGSYSQGPDGALGFRVASASSHGSIVIRDNADFTDGNQVRVLLEAAHQLQDGDSMLDVVAAGSFTLPSGEFDVRDNSLFWDFDQAVDGSTLDLTARYLGVAPVLARSGQTFTESQLAFVEELVTGGYGTRFSALFDALGRAPDAAAAADTLEGIGPALAGAAGNSARSASNGASNAISARMGERRGASSGDAFSSNTVWLKPYLGKAEQDSVNGLDGYDVDTNGFVLGIDSDVSGAWRVGVAVASAQSDVKGDKATLDVDTTQFTLYGSYAISDSAALDLDLNHVVNSFDSARRVAVIGALAVSSHNGSQLGFGARVSNRVAMGGKSVFIPALQVRYNRVDLDSYSETGAGVYNLTVGNSKEDSLLWAAEAAFEVGMGPGALLANAGVGYDTLDAASVTATLSGAGPTFVNNGIEPESTVVTGGLGYRYVTSRNLEINTVYDMEGRGDFMAQTVSLKFRMPF